MEQKIFSVLIQIDRDATVPLHQQISASIERGVDSGSFRIDRNLPSVRALSTRLGVSPATVTAAYRTLLDRGVVEARPRSGYRVVSQGSKSHALAGVSVQTEAGRPRLPFHRIEPNLAMHPVAEVGHILAQVATEAPESGGYEDYRGYLPLREILSERFTADGVLGARVDGMLITGGAQHAISLCARALRARSSGSAPIVAVEDPVYPGARLAFEYAGAQVIPIPMTEDGPDLAKLDALGSRIDLFYCCPTYGNPTGRSWSVSSRERVLRLAAHHSFAIFEDDYLGDLDYLDEKLPRLASDFPRTGATIIYVRTYSKCLLPALRLAGVVAPPEFLGPLFTAKMTDDICGSAFLQRSAARFLEGAAYDEHLTRVRPYYRSVREALRARARIPSSGIAYDDPPAGLCLMAKLPAGIDEERFAEACAAEGVLISPGSAYWADPSRGLHLFRIGFGGITLTEIDQAFSRLDRAVERVQSPSKDDFFKRALL